MTSVETEKSFDIFFGRTQKMHSNMQKSSFFAENEGGKRHTRRISFLVQRAIKPPFSVENGGFL
jgi:hypothetical protein